jgi:short-subunit dehydrogenase
MFDSQDIALITGCGSGIGKALARRLHQSGVKVCATARRPETMADLSAEGLLTLPLDVCKHEQIDAVLQQLHAQGLRVRMLINNAGYGAMGPLLDVPLEVWRDQFEVNVFAPVALIRAVLPDMVSRRRGMVVNVSSISGVAPTPFASPYCASKAAVNALSDSLRMELAPLGISVVTVQPGGIRSTFGESAGNKVSLQPHSPFQAVKAGIMDRAQEGQKDAMPAEVFAQQVVRTLLSPGCPTLIRCGEKSRLLPMLKRVLPDRVLDTILSRRFQLDRLRSNP